MDIKHPTLVDLAFTKAEVRDLGLKKKRPLKLPYFPDIARPSKRWKCLVFDDLDSASSDDDLPPRSPVLCAQSSEKRRAEMATSPVLQLCLPAKQPHSQKEAMRPAVRLESPILDNDMDIPFKDHGPMHTSSPIGAEVDVEEPDSGGEGLVQEVSPLLFACDEDVQEGMKREPPPTQTSLCDGKTTQRSDGAAWLESPPKDFSLRKSKTFRTVIPSRSYKCQTPVLETRGKTPFRQESAVPPVSAEMLEPQHPTQGSEVESKRAAVDKLPNKAVFLHKLKLKEPGPPTPARKLLPPEVPIPPEPDDDFMILEDDALVRFSISKKSRHNRSRTSSTDEGGSTKKGAKDSQSGKAETPPAPGEAEIGSTEEPRAGQWKRKGKAAQQTVVSRVPVSTTAKMTPGVKMKGSEPDPGVEAAVFSSQENLPADNGMKRGKQNIKKPKSGSSDEGRAADKAESRPPKSATAESSIAEHSVKNTEEKEKGRSKDVKENLWKRRVKVVKKSRARIQGSGASEEPLPTEAAKEWSPERSPEPSCEDHDPSPPEQKATPAPETTKPKQQRKATTKAPASVQTKQSKPSSGSDRDPSQEVQTEEGKRRRNKPGLWWMCSPPESIEEEADGEERHKNRNSKATVHSPVKTGQAGDVEEGYWRPSSSQTAEQKAETGKRANKRTKKRLTHGERTFDIVPGSAAPTSPKRPPDHSKSPIPQKRMRRSEPGGTSSTQANPKTKRHKSLSLGVSQTGFKIPNPQPKPQPRSAPKSVRTSLATFKEIFTETPVVVNRSRKTNLFPVQEQEDCTPVIRASDLLTADPSSEPASETESPFFFMEPAGECRNTMILPSSSRLDDLQESRQLSDNTLKGFRSGPVSMLELEEYEDSSLPSKMRPVLTELCSHPLLPMELPADDQPTVAKWLKAIWPANVTNGTHVSVERFDWYTYRTRVLGVMMDLQNDSLSNGKLLLGSYTKKPLWVDHSATSVFNILTGNVRVIINCNKSFYNPGQCFLAPCGHAYSIQNMNREPAVLYFTRVVAECAE